MPNKIDLASVHAKIARAEEHFDALNREVLAWMKNSSNEIVRVERSKDHTRCGLVTRMVGQKPDYQRWTIIVGDLVNNLRCALDHLVYSVAKYETRTQPTADIERLAFPIVDSPALFREKNNARRLNFLSSDEINAIEQVQPYIRGHATLPPLLQILREFSNADKHRLLRLAAAAAVSWEVKFVSPLNDSRKFLVNPDPIEDDTIVCVIVSPRGDPNLTFEGAEIIMAISLWHGLRAGDTDRMHSRTNYSILLPLLIDEVKSVVTSVASTVV